MKLLRKILCAIGLHDYMFDPVRSDGGKGDIQSWETCSSCHKRK